MRRMVGILHDNHTRTKKKVAPLPNRQARHMPTITAQGLSIGSGTEKLVDEWECICHVSANAFSARSQSAHIDANPISSAKSPPVLAAKPSLVSLFRSLDSIHSNPQRFGNESRPRIRTTVFILSSSSSAIDIHPFF